MTVGSPFDQLPDRMWAAWIDQLGGPERIRYGELPVPKPGPTDVLVRVEAVAVNPVDTFVRSGAFPTPMSFPFVIGRDFAGTVVAARAAGFAAGDPVWCNSLGHDGRQGAAAQYAVVPAERLYHLPGAVEPLAAVAVAHPAATAHVALAVHAGLRAGETVYVAGGGGHVGGAAVLLAARAGPASSPARARRTSTGADRSGPTSRSIIGIPNSRDGSAAPLPTESMCTSTPPDATISKRLSTC